MILVLFTKEVIEISTQKKSLGFIILTISNVLSKAMSLLYVPFLIATIGDEGYGIYYASYNVYAFVYMFALSGTSTVIPKLIAEYSSQGYEEDAIASFKIGNKMMLFTGCLMALLLALSSSKLASFIGYEKAYLALLSLAPSIILTAVNSSLRSYFQGRHNMTPLAISQIVEQVGNTVFTIGCSYMLMKISLEYGVAGGAMGTTIGAFLSLCYLLYKYRKDKHIVRDSKPRCKTDKEIFIYMFKFAIPLIISTGFIYATNNLVDVANIKSGLLKAGFSDTYATIRYGNFGNFMQLVNVPMIVISSLSLTVFPILAQANASKNKETLSDTITQIFKICFMVAIPSAIGLSILSEPIFDMIFVSSVYKGSDILRFGSFIIISYALFQLSNTVLNSVGKVYHGTFSATTGAVIKLTCNFILIPIAKINIYGAIVGLFLSQIIPFMINYHNIKKHIGTKDNLLINWKQPFISGILMGVCVFISYSGISLVTNGLSSYYISNIISVVLSIYIGGIVYIHSLIKTKGITENDITMIPAKIRKLLLIK